MALQNALGRLMGEIHFIVALDIFTNVDTFISARRHWYFIITIINIRRPWWI